MNWHVLLDIAPYQWHSVGASIFCGTLIGLERQIRGKPVGIRTASLIILGTYLFLSSAFLLEGKVMDPSRVIGQVITGVGFLGAGVMWAKDGGVVGVTSAATIWVLAALGVMISVDHHLAAIKLSVLVVFILYGIDYLEKHIKMLGRGVHGHVKSFKKRRKLKE